MPDDKPTAPTTPASGWASPEFAGNHGIAGGMLWIALDHGNWWGIRVAAVLGATIITRAYTHCRCRVHVAANGECVPESHPLWTLIKFIWRITRSPKPTP